MEKLRRHTRTLDRYFLIRAHLQGSYQALQLVPHQKISLFKEEWDSYHLDTLNDAADASNQADVGSIVAEPGLCNVALLTRSTLKKVAKIQVSLPKKRGAGSVESYEKKFGKFFDKIYVAVCHNFDFNALKVVLVGTPGHLSEQIINHIKERAIRENNVTLSRSISMFISCSTASGHLSSLYTALNDPNVARFLNTTKVALEVQKWNSFLSRLARDSSLCQYGFRAVSLCDEAFAIAELFITDSMFRTTDKERRKYLVDMTDRVKQSGGEVHVLSSFNETGQRLNAMGGIAATLKFPVQAAEELEDSESETE
ncbi:hypothetical protein GEMRC1_012324 [Eukaryota sp. GEM-RC1]